MNNKQLRTSSSYGLIYSGAVFTVENSCILGNEANYQVYGSLGSTISNCSIDFGSSSIYRATITQTPAKSFIIKIACFETVACEAFYDSYKELSFPPDQPQTKKVIMYSCENRRIWDAHFIFELIVLISFFVSN